MDGMHYFSSKVYFIQFKVFFWIEGACIPLFKRSGAFSMKASSHKPESMKDCNKILPPSTRSDCIFFWYNTSIICGRISLLKSNDMYSVNAFGWQGDSRVNTNVFILPLKSSKSRGNVNSLSITRRTGCLPYQFRVDREGLSSNAVCRPTNIASCSARFCVPACWSADWKVWSAFLLCGLYR